MVVPASLVAHLGDLTLSDSETDGDPRHGRGPFLVHAQVDYAPRAAPRTAPTASSRVSTGALAGTSGPHCPPPLPPLPSQAAAGPQWTPMAVLTSAATPATDTAWAQAAAWPDEDDFGSTSRETRPASVASKRDSKQETDV